MAQHKARGQCGAYTSNQQLAARESEPVEEENVVPVLEEAEEWEGEELDVEARRELADKLAEEGVWPGE